MEREKREVTSVFFVAISPTAQKIGQILQRENGNGGNDDEIP